MLNYSPLFWILSSRMEPCGTRVLNTTTPFSQPGGGRVDSNLKKEMMGFVFFFSHFLFLAPALDSIAKFKRMSGVFNDLLFQNILFHGCFPSNSLSLYNISIFIGSRLGHYVFK